MLTELCQELRNWFDKKRLHGEFTITNGAITYKDGSDIGILENQYYRIAGSIFSDGVHQKGNDTEELADETFTGSVWLLAIPKEVVALADEIAAWRAKYEDVNSEAMSPYTAESFGGYSYSKNAPGSSAGAGSSAASWKSVFKAQLNAYRKILP